jgi:hypothetical protein
MKTDDRRGSRIRKPRRCLSSIFFCGILVSACRQRVSDPAPYCPTTGPTIDGSHEKATVEGRKLALAFLGGFGKTRDCYNKWSLKNPSAAASLEIQAMISPSGRVLWACADNVHGFGRSTVECLVEAFRRTDFDASPYQRRTVVPIHFTLK